MVDHDRHVGKLLDLLDTPDRRGHDRDVLDRQRPPHEHVAGRGDDTVPQREEHELGGRVPRPSMVVRWPGKIPAGAVSNEINQPHDFGCPRSSPRATRTSSRS